MFDNEIRDLINNGYNIIPLSQAIDFVHGLRTIPPKAVVITSDDGYAGMYFFVYPILKKHKIPATFFIVAGIINKNPTQLT